MVRFVCATAVAIAALTLGQRPVAAREAPWCAVVNDVGDVTWYCEYNSVEECVPHVLAGNRGFCNPNPRFHGGQQEQKHSTRRHTRRKHIRQ